MNILLKNTRIFGNHAVTKTLNIIVPIIGIIAVAYYIYCDTACSSLKGTILGIDLKYTGILYMSFLLASAFFAGEPFGRYINFLRTLALSAGVGSEFILIGFQVVHNIYCPFCIVFSICIFILFGINFKSMDKKLMLVSVLAGFLGFALFFEGQVIPRYDLSLLRPLY